MRRADFFQLSRRIQERFIGATRGGGLPAPMLSTPLRSRAPTVWAVLGTAGLGGLGVVAAWGFGRLDCPGAMAPRSTVAVYCLLLALALSGWLGMFRVLARSRELPYTSGVYLFPVGAVRASGRKLEVFPWTDLRAHAISNPPRLRLGFARAKSFEFALRDDAHGAAILDQIERAAQRWAAAESTGDPQVLGTLDPLLDDGIPNPLLSDIRLTPRRLWWARIPWWLGLVAGVGLGYPAWMARNYWAERALLRAAVRADSPAAYRAYLATAGPKREVTRVLLPRAELREAERSRSPAQVEQVIARYPDAEIRPEVDQALRRTLLVELERARRTGTSGALRRFFDQQPHRALVEKELQAALHGLYVAALDSYEREATPRHPELATSMKQLLTYAERHGARAEIRFSRKYLPSVVEADRRVLTSPYAHPTESLPSRYFDREHAERRERPSAETLGRRFAQTLPRDLVSFELGPPLPEDQADSTELAVPTLAVEHTTLMNGIFATPSPPAVFVGVGILFRARLMVPGRPRTEFFKWSFWQAPDLDRIRGLGLGTEQAYDEIATAAFEQFCARYLAGWFKNP